MAPAWWFAPHFRATPAPRLPAYMFPQVALAAGQPGPAILLRPWIGGAFLSLYTLRRTSPAMTESVRYGVVSCGKRAPGPFEKKFGACILEPGHGDDVPCRFKNLEGSGSVAVTALPVPDDIAEAVAELGRHIVKLERARRNMRRTSFLLALALAANLASAGWSIGRLMGWLP